MLLYNIESMAQKMATEYANVSEKISHMGTRGSAREDVLKDVIRQLIPERFRVGSGIVVDAYETQSKQQDLFIFDAINSPVFLKTESFNIIPVESVFATVEIKSTLRKDTLCQSLENIKSIKMLKRSELITSPWVSSRHNQIMSSVFAYTSDTSIETVAHNLEELCREIPYKLRPSVICIFDKGIIVNVLKSSIHQIVFPPSDQTMLGIIKNEQEVNLYLYYLLLQQHLCAAQNFPPDLMRYALSSHKLDDVKIIIPKDMIPDDMTLLFGDVELNATEIRFLGEYNQLIFKLLSGTITESEYNTYGKEKIFDVISKFKQIIQKSFGANPVFPHNSNE